MPTYTLLLLVDIDYFRGHHGVGIFLSFIAAAFDVLLWISLLKWIL